MKDLLRCCIVISFLIATVIPQSAALGVEETCQIVKEGTYIADPANCQGWVQCRNGLPIYGVCDDGFLFDVVGGTCSYADRVVCTRNTSNMCYGITNVYKADPFNCQNYCYCNEGESYCRSCPYGQYFNPSTVACEWPSDTQCGLNSPCFLAPNGYVKDINSCAGWFFCTYGEVVTAGDCDSDYYFNAKLGICDVKQNVQCEFDADIGAPKPPIPQPYACMSMGIDVGFVSDGSTCRGYFFCSSAADVAPIWGQCPKGSNFDPSTMACTDPYLVQCLHNRCEGISKTFMTIPGTLCTEYYVCNNGAAVASGKCPSSYPYFNEEAQVCQTIQLDFPICASSSW